MAYILEGVLAGFAGGLDVWGRKQRGLMFLV
jgi:hypothetical protein